MKVRLDDITEEGDELVCVVWHPAWPLGDGAAWIEVVGRVNLDQGAGFHVVDVTDPRAPTIMDSPSWPRKWWRRP